MARAILELIGDPESLLRSFKKSSQAADKFGRDIKQLGVTAEQSARAQIQAATKRDARLRQEIAVYKQVASAAQKGSREQIAAANLATRAEERLGRSLAVTAAEAKAHAANVSGAERELGRFARGAAAGSGLVSGLGRSLAFASGGFLAFASLAEVGRKSVDAAQEDLAAERQLGAQFKANRQNLGRYRDEIDKSIASTSQLAGFNRTQLTESFTTAFRVTRNVEQALKIESIAANVARARHLSLGTSTIALAKAYGGAATGLRRLGIIIPTNLHGMAALAYVQARVAGQARAGTTSFDRFHAAVYNFEVALGTGLLPTLNKYLTQASKWLNNTENQKRVQHDVSAGAKILGGALGGIGKTFEFLTSKQGQVLTGFALTKQAFHGLKTIIHAVNLELSSYQGKLLRPVSGEDVFLRGSTQVAGVGVPLRGGKPFKPKASLDYQISLANLLLAQAQVTATKKDDRYRLMRLRALEREKLAQTKSLADQISLTQTIGSLTEQIAQIDTAAAADRKTAADKQLAARKAALATEQKRLADEKKVADKELSTLKQRESALKSKIKAITDSFQSAVSTARSGIGDLFGGPVLNFSDEQRKAALGIPNTAADPKALVRDLHAQVAAEAARQRSIRRIGRLLPKGALKSRFLGELEAGGSANAVQLSALAGSPKDARAFFGQFRARENLATHIARASMTIQFAQLHVARSRLADVRGREAHVQVYIDGVEQKQAKVKVKQSAAQRRGEHPGRS